MLMFSTELLTIPSYFNNLLQRYVAANAKNQKQLNCARNQDPLG
jgi:hypothetical protein